MKEKIAVIFTDLDDQVKTVEELALLLEKLYYIMKMMRKN